MKTLMLVPALSTLLLLLPASSCGFRLHIVHDPTCQPDWDRFEREGTPLMCAGR